ncbi:RNA-binding cell elongation regulator Jag/EloR [Paenibacillus popilliae]|uniref:RNA-binding protein KhpB n=1 Tax=Paenibacillus popilliae ATCC 14706 TaxID=1212764 RepID=M9L858_PAEPP|nr:RNA-binding cell elongation regulator Jag/EloR [Paenibacillus popilliae]GAC41297.1 predicted RNA-binding protein [Paenibacillus popilliae ATCC 14706]
MNTLIVSGKTIEDAIKNGLAQWKVAEDRVTVRVLEKPSRGLFGWIGVRPATVELTLLEKPPSPSPAAGAKAEEEAALPGTEAGVEAAEQGPDPIEEAKRFIINATRAMGLEVDVSVRKRKDTVLFDLSGSDLGLIIGRRGQTLDSLQYLTGLVANRYSKHHLRIILDAEQFRERRKKTLEALADRLANKAVRNRQEVVLEPMTPQERKIIHAKLQDHPRVKTSSKGVEPNRCIVISVK